MGYDGRLAIEDVSFDLEQGDYLCIVGENGSGKSTLVKGILGLLKPISGQIELYGAKQTEIGYMPQQTIIQKDFPASVLEVVLSGCLSRTGALPFYSRREKERAKDSIAELSIEDLARRSYRDLSGGQQQRVLLARALCATERLLVLDEPVAGLDPIATSELYALIDRINREHGITIIMVSHDVRSAVQHATKVLHLHKKVTFFGKAADYIAADPSFKMIGGAGIVPTPK